VIVALLNQKGGVGKTTLALHLAGRWSELGQRVLVIDADPQGSALDWQAARGREGLAKSFAVVGLPRDLLHLDLPEIARGYDRVVIDGPPRMGVITRSALLAADLVLIPATPSPIDGWASAEMLRMLGEARVYRPGLPARLVLNRVAARTIIARETADDLADHDPPALASRVGQRIAFAYSARSGRLVQEVLPDGIAAREIATLAAEIDGLPQ
jgi:chromosome partitioning protein